MPDIPQLPKPDPVVHLDGWDSIAHYLGVHKRTARAWYENRSLPVHQLFGKGGRVYALAAELDEWRARSDASESLPEPVQPPVPPPDSVPAAGRTEQAIPARNRQRRLFVAVAAMMVAVVSLTILARRFGMHFRQFDPPASPGRLLARLSAEGGHLDTIRVGPGPCNAVLTPDGARLFVANCTAETVSVIDTAAGKVIRELPVGPQPESLALDRSGQRLYVGNFWGGIRVFDVETGNSLEKIPIEGPVSDILVAPGDTLFVARREKGLAAIHPGDRAVTPIPVTAMPMYLALNAEGSRLYISYQGRMPGGRRAHDAIDVYDTNLKRFVAGISGPPRVGGRMALSPSGVLLADGVDACFAAFYQETRPECPASPGSIFSLIRTADSRIIATLGYPDEPNGAIGSFPDGLRAVAANRTLRVIDIASLSVREALPLPNVRRVLFAPDGKRAWAVLQEPGAIAVLDTSKGACIAPPRGLAGWWPGDGSADDARGANNNGRLTGSAGFAPGLVGQAFRFDGSGSVSLGTLENLSTEFADSTMMAWVKLSAADAGEQTIFDRMTDAGGLRLSVEEDGRIRLVAAVDPKARVVATTSATLRPGVWTHIAAMRTEDSVSIYMNGSRAALERLQGAGWRRPLMAGEVLIGGSMRGLVDEVQWYNRALDPGEIAAVSSAGNSGVCEP